MYYNNEISEFINTLGVSDFGFCNIENFKDGSLLGEYPGSGSLNYAVSIVIKLSDAVIDGITDAPTHSYFHHYRTVNTHIDNVLLKLGMYVESKGYKYIPIAASQSINGMQGLFQHKTAARLAGLGGIGKSGLFISVKYGPRVRLGTLVTDMPFEVGAPFEKNICGECRKCVLACPAMAISNTPFSEETPMCGLDRKMCSDFMKDKFKMIGRGAVCGICMRVCPHGGKNSV